MRNLLLAGAHDLLYRLHAPHVLDVLRAALLVGFALVVMVALSRL